MTPKEKADQLIRLMTVDMNIDFWQTKHCALTAVQEIIYVISSYPNANETETPLSDAMIFWQQVKIELEKYGNMPDWLSYDKRNKTYGGNK